MSTRREFLEGSVALGGLLSLGIPTVLAQTGGASGSATNAAPGATPSAPGGAHELPPLPYAVDALEPHLDAQTMTLHHDKHHAAYVKGLNAAEAGLADARKNSNFDLAQKLETELAFHGSGHYNHTVFWNNMNAAGKAKAAPSGDLLKWIDRDFGGVDALKAQFSAAATKVEGNGWGVLAYHPMFRRLYTVAMMSQQNAQLSGAVPLLMCDVWEHAYYLKYQNVRADYVKAWWNVVDWADVEARFASAMKLG
ncbi:MAG: superoxide dismutase [bacterium]